MTMSEAEIYQLYFAPGSRFEKWSIVHEIGAGPLGKVFLARSGCTPEDGSYGVLKVFLGSHISLPLFEAFLKQEYKILTSLDGHVNIVKPLPQERYSLWKGDVEIHYLTLEYCPGGNLEGLRSHYPQGVLPPLDAFLCLEQIIQGLQYAHDKDVIHADICADNILLMQPTNLKISDFGLSRISASKSELFGRRLPYQAPESLLHRQISKETDIWALGILLYRLLTGSFPFVGKDESELLRSITTQPLCWPKSLQNIEETVAASLVYFIGRMLSPDPSARPTSREIAMAIQRSHYLVNADEAARFSENFQNHIASADLRRSMPLQNVAIATPQEASPDGNSEFWKKTAAPAALPKRKFRWGVITVVCTLALFAAIYWGARHVLPEEQMPWQEVWHVEMDTGASLSPYVVQITCRVKRNHHALGWQEMQRRKAAAILHYRHESGSNGSVLLEEVHLRAAFPWTIPADCPDGKLALWIELRADKETILSPQMQLHIQGLQEDRQMFRQAEENARQYANAPNYYESVAQEFYRYMQHYPQGFYVAEAQAKWQEYRDKAREYQQKILLLFAEQHPEKITDIVARCEQFLGKYQESKNTTVVEQLRDAYRLLLKPTSYTITLVKASFANKFDRADSYVQVLINGAQIFVSQVSKNNNQPTWNLAFEMLWKAGDTIEVKIFDKNVWKDTRYFQAQDSSQFSLGLLCKRLQDKANWVEFSVRFPFASYPALAKKYGK
jgi:serine/threonine protein kinase